MHILSNLINLLPSSYRLFAAGFFGFPTWYEYLPVNETTGEIVWENGFELMDMWLILAALLDMVVRLAGMLAVAYFIYSGFVLMTSQNSPERISTGRKGMLNATIGLIIAMLSATLIRFIAGIFEEESANTEGVDIPTVAADSNTLGEVLRYIFVILGAIAVLMVVLGGIRYIVAAGNPQQIATAKNTIIYALVGLIISVSAFVIVNFIFSAVDTAPGSSRGGVVASIERPSP